MSVLDWLTRSVGADLDAKVHGSDGVSHVRYEGLVDDADLIVRAAIASEQAGTIVITGRPQAPSGDKGEEKESGASPLVRKLGTGEAYRGTDLTVEADVTMTGNTSLLAALTVQVSQPDPDRAQDPPLGFQTYSVEGRFDEHGRARLGIVVRLG